MRGGAWGFEVYNDTLIYLNEVFLTPVLVLACCKTWVISCIVALKVDRRGGC